MKRGFVIGILVWPALMALALGADAPPPPNIHFAAQQKSSRPNPAVVRVVAPGSGSISFGSGTLVAVNEKHGLVITNWHVINEATAPISVMFPDGFSSPATVLKIDRDWDLAALAIHKPNVAPIPLATKAPRSGDMLTIAGYGSGTYREATGPCTQYVAPGTKFPYEMVELSAAARQGDSGGPIFNDRGELAGVLFGQGHGRTAGSYCGRVQWFMTSLAPGGRKPDVSTFVAVPGQQPRAGQRGAQVGSLLARNPRTDSASESAKETPIDQFATREQPLQPSTTQSRTKAAPPREPAEPFATASVTQDAAVDARSRPEPAPRPTRNSDLPQPDGSPQASGGPTESIGWREIAGDTLGQQIKTVFAGVGVLALALHTLALLGRDRK